MTLLGFLPLMKEKMKFWLYLLQIIQDFFFNIFLAHRSHCVKVPPEKKPVVFIDLKGYSNYRFLSKLLCKHRGKIRTLFILLVLTGYENDAGSHFILLQNN